MRKSGNVEKKEQVKTEKRSLSGLNRKWDGRGKKKMHIGGGGG